MDLIVLVHGEYDPVLARVVNGNILTRLKETKFPNLFGRNTASGEVRDTAVFKDQPDAGDIGLLGKNRQARGLKAVERAVDKLEHDVKIVNHQIQHHVHIQAAR